MNKLISVLLLSTMVLVLILGCNHEGDDDSSSTTTTETTAPQETQAPTPAVTEEDTTTTSTGDTDTSETSDTTETVDPQVLIDLGMGLAQSTGCTACHSTDGAQSVGPTWLGLYGKTRTLTDGSEVVADDAYIKESVLEPSAKVVEGFPPAMPAYQWDEDQIQALIAYIQSLTE
jgi:cytochrome c2